MQEQVGYKVSNTTTFIPGYNESHCEAFVESRSNLNWTNRELCCARNDIAFMQIDGLLQKLFYNVLAMRKHLQQAIILGFILAFVLNACSPAVQKATATAQSTNSVTAPSPTEIATETPAPLPVCSLPLPGPADWPLFICDTFDGTRQTFPNESEDNAYARYNARMTDGQVYQVDYAAKGFGQFQRSALTWFDIAKAQDFALSISGTMDSAFKDVSWGIGFRGSDDRKSFFLFSIMNNGTYALEILENGKWISLISRRVFSGILPGQKNTITVIVEGQNFKFLINGQPVESFSGGLLTGMDDFLVVSASEGATAVFTFDDLVMQI